MLWNENGHTFRRVLNIEAERSKGETEAKRTQKKQDEEERVKVALSREDLCRSRWIVGINLIATRWG